MSTPCILSSLSLTHDCLIFDLQRDFLFRSTSSLSLYSQILHSILDSMYSEPVIRSSELITSIKQVFNLSLSLLSSSLFPRPGNSFQVRRCLDLLYPSNLAVTTHLDLEPLVPLSRPIMLFLSLTLNPSPHPVLPPLPPPPRAHLLHKRNLPLQS